ncbi:MAG: ABC transporter ATP-binding protein [Planctomycetaceae bacterium]
MKFCFGLRQFKFRYQSKHNPILQADEIDIPSGTVVSVIGPSGSGKSTLVGCLGLLRSIKNSDGQILFHGSAGVQDYSTLSTEQSEDLRRRRFGFALQNSYLLPHLTVLDNLIIPLALKGVAEKHRRAMGMEFLKCMPDLLERQNAPVSQISGGQKQRIGVLRALIHDPDVVFADEPFSSLDQENEHLMLKSLLDWQRGELTPTTSSHSPDRTLFLVTHDLNVAATISQYRLAIEKGQLNLTCN